MIPLQEFKDSLGDKLKELTEEEVLKLRENQDAMASILFDLWLKEVKQ